MIYRPDRSGFTLIEVLVASLLMGMLVVILTMVFNQSSIAWTTGRATVAELDEIRYGLGIAQRQADNVLTKVVGTADNRICKVVSPWNTETRAAVNGMELRNRSIRDVLSNRRMFTPAKLTGGSGVSWQQTGDLGQQGSGEAQKQYLVGVLSFGPDGLRDTEDDISSWPDNVE